MTVDETEVDETVVDETGVDELGINLLQTLHTIKMQLSFQQAICYLSLR